MDIPWLPGDVVYVPTCDRSDDRVGSFIYAGPADEFGGCLEWPQYPSGFGPFLVLGTELVSRPWRFKDRYGRMKEFSEEDATMLYVLDPSTMRCGWVWGSWMKRMNKRRKT